MKPFLTLVLFFVFIQKARAEEIVTTVFNVIPSTRTERLLVLSAADGRVYKMELSEDNQKYLSSLIGRIVKLSYVTDGRESLIRDIKIMRESEVDQTVYDLNHFQYNELRTFAPTDLQTYDRAQTIFQNMLNDGDRRQSQCFKRAHMWAYDMWSQLGIFSQKIFIFYTQRYIQLEDFEWWFHVAPVVTAGGIDYAMDGTFLNKPVTISEWQKHFMGQFKVTCPVIEKYQMYSEKQWQKLCYLMKVPMYYFGPITIEMRDKKNQKRNHWVLEELQDARRAFKNYQKHYEHLDTGKKTIKF